MSGLANLAATFGNRVSTNLSNSFSSLTLQQWIRLVAVAGAYLLLRPYLIKIGAKIQMKQHEKEEAAAEEERALAAAKMTANEFRGHKVLMPEDSDSDSDDGRDGEQAASGADWGKRARRRQRQMVKKILAEHEKKLQEQQEDEEDKDIQEFLVG